MKLFFILIAAVLMIAGPGQGQETVTSMDRAKRVMAIRAAAKRVIEDSRAFLDAPQTRAVMRSKMESFMKADIPAHQNKSASRKLCQERTRTLIQDMLVSNVVIAVAEVSQQSPLPITVPDILANVAPNWTGSVAQVAVTFTERYFDDVFSEARANVTASQRFEAEKKIAYPPAAELNRELTRLGDGKAMLGRADFDSAGKWWLNETAKNLPPLYEEVQAALNTNFKNIGNEIAVQYEHQRVLVQNSVSNRNELSRYLTSRGIHDRIAYLCREELQKTARATPKSTAGPLAPAYELFDVNDASVRTNADRLETEFFSEYAKALNAIPVSTKELTRAILAEPAAQKSARQSAELLSGKITREYRGWAASNYVLRTETDASIRNNATIGYIAGLMETGVVAAAWSECAKRTTEAPITAARAEIARQQMEKYFSRLNSAEILPDDAVNTLAEKRNFARFKSLVELRESLPEFSGAGKDTADLLEETEALALARANELIAAAEQAARGQERCLRELEKEKMPQLEQQVAARKPVKEIISEWDDEVSKRWAEQARETSSPYRSILGRTENLLNKTVRQLYDAKLARAEKRTSPQNAAPQVDQEEKPRDQQSAQPETAPAVIKISKKTKGDTSADLFLVIRDVDKGACEAQLEAADGSVLSKTVFNPDRVEDASETVLAASRKTIVGTIASKQTVSRGALFGLLPARRAGLKEFNMFIVAQSARVRLKTSLLLRQKIENLIDEWAQESSTPAPKLRWGSGFSGNEKSNHDD